MRTIIQILAVLFAGLLLSVGTGCATYGTISQAELGSAKVLSGTRLNIHALNGYTTPTKKFKASAPPYPWVDLPFSLVLDVVLLPLTTSAALYEVIFE